MRGIKINDVHTSENDFMMILSNKPKPLPKEYIIAIDGATDIDVSDVLGGVSFNNSVHQYRFFCDGMPYSERKKAIDNFLNSINGNSITIEHDDLKGYVYSGRAKVTEELNHAAYSEFAIEVNCGPFALSKNDITKSTSLSSAETECIIKVEGVMEIIPLVDVSEKCTIKYKTVSIQLSAGKFYLDELRLEKGKNSLLLSGTGLVSFTYKEGVF